MFYDDVLFQAVTTAMDLDVPMSLMPLVITDAELEEGLTVLGSCLSDAA